MAYAPSQAFEHGLNPRKGWFQPHALDCQAKLSDNVTFDVPAGRVAHLNAAGEYEMGISGTKMPIFLFSGSTDADVSNPGTSAGGYFAHQAIMPDGDMLGLVATGGYEVETTEFEVTSSYGAYARNQLLTATASNTVLATGGVLTNDGTGASGNVKQFVDPVCGVVSAPVRQTLHKISVLSLWTYFLPGAYA